MKQGGQLVFDITDMVRFAHSSDQLSGVPRVSLTLSYQAYRLWPDRVKVGYFDAVTGKYRVLGDPHSLSDLTRLRSHLRRNTADIRPLKPWKYGGRPARSAFHALRRQTAIRLQKLKSLLAIGRKRDGVFSFSKADQLICLGGAWNSLGLFDHLAGEAYRGTRPRLTVLVHDMMPLMAPAFPNAGDAQHFTYWLERMMAAKATLLFYSASSERDARAWLERDRKACPREGGDGNRFSEESSARSKGKRHREAIPTKRFRLGDELILFSAGPIRDEVKRLHGKNFLLFVGSMNGRKNGAKLLEALKILLLANSNQPFPALVVAGSSTPADLRRLHFHEAEIPEVIFITKPADAELADLYRHCRFTVFPSLYEGWGLPIGESLWHNKVCATSNVSSMPEVGGDDCEYFDPHDPADIVRALAPLIFDDAYLANRTESIDYRRLWSWRDSAEDLLRVLTDAPRDQADAAGAPGGEPRARVRRPVPAV
jgi:glycosyltransferase involved in cell wall biosynthesis